MSAEGGTKAILAAMFANAGIAVAKFVGFLVTGSSSMLAESVHSVADTGNQGLLLLGGKRAKREADAEHPFGYGRDRYFYAFVVALVLFSLGSLFALYEGYEKIRHPEELTSPLVAVVILLVAVGLEGFSFRTAVKESLKVKAPEQSWVSFIRRTKSPELPVVLLEDAGALTGLVLALGGVGLSLLTDDPVWDGVGTVSIGLLLGVIAVLLAIEMKSLLIGESARASDVRAIRGALVGEGVERVIHLRTLHLGPDELMVAAKIAPTPSLDVAGVARAIDAAEVRVRAAVPIARVIYLEPDLDRGPSAVTPPGLEV